MPKCIEGSLKDGGRIVDDPWTTVATPDALRAVDVAAAVIVPLDVFVAEKESSLMGGRRVGVLLHGDDNPATLADDLARIDLVAIDFPKFTDGRGYSIARVLRERHRYAGSLRAVGDVLRDQIFYLLRCGFDSFVMRHEEQIEDALRAYRDFSDAYQSSVERPVPWFARRGSVAAEAP